MITFSTFRQYIQSDVPACPKPVVEKAVREAVTEFCLVTRMLKTNADEIPIVADTSEYAITFTGLDPDTESEGVTFGGDDTVTFGGEAVTFSGEEGGAGSGVSKEYRPVDIDYAYLGDLGDETEIEVTSKLYMDNSIYLWRSQTGTTITKVFLTMTDGKARVYPTPEADLTDNLNLQVVVVPTISAVEIDDIIYNEHVEDIRLGALMRLYNMSTRQWADLKEAVIKKRQWQYAMAVARTKSIQGKNSLPVVASYAGSSMF